MTLSPDLERQQKQPRTDIAVADRSVSETRYFDDVTITTGDICDKEDGRLLLAGACDNCEDGGAAPVIETTAVGDGQGTNAAPAVDIFQEEAAEEEAEEEGEEEAEEEGEEEAGEGEGDDGEPSLWSALTFAWVTPTMRLGARTTLQSADLPPPPRTWRADWLDAQTARIMDGEQGERGRKREEHGEWGRKEEEQCEGEQGGRREGNGSGQLVVSGGWKAGGRAGGSGQRTHGSGRFGRLCTGRTGGRCCCWQ
ncbi:unnamed protein product [Closterium sp. NIES-65]|nr:unnamed protein product [Closterium sp. NIES-65]